MVDDERLRLSIWEAKENWGVKVLIPWRVLETEDATVEELVGRRMSLLPTALRTLRSAIRRMRKRRQLPE